MMLAPWMHEEPAPIVYYHGGRPGMKAGQLILPPSITGVRSQADYMPDHSCRKDRVYVATAFDAACLYAGGYPHPRGGCVYEVEPIGTLEPDPDCDMPGLSYAVEKARIVRVHKLSYNQISMIPEAIVS